MDAQTKLEEARQEVVVLRRLLAAAEARVAKLAEIDAVFAMAAAEFDSRTPTAAVQRSAIAAPPVPEANEKPWFEESYGDCPHCGKSLRLVPAGGHWRAFIGCTGWPECQYKRPLTSDERKAHEKQREQHHGSHLQLDHRSGCGYNAFDLKEKIVQWLASHHWRKEHGYTIVREGVQGSTWGKQVFDAMMKELQAEGKILIEHGTHNRLPCRRVRLTQKSSPVAPAPAEEVY